MSKFALIKSLVALAAISLAIVSFQNCGRQFKAVEPVQGVPEEALSAIKVSSPTCQFNGATIPEYGSVVAYLNSSVAPGKSCVSEIRSCKQGVLSGSYSYSSCAVGALSSCLFNGQTLLSGQSVTAYSSSVVSTGSFCEKMAEQRFCNNGVLSGSYNYATCQQQAYESCLFNGQTIAHGSSVLAYLSSSVNPDQSCVLGGNSEQRICNNGILSGSYNYSSCKPASYASCLFNGQTVSHGQSVNAYLSPSSSPSADCRGEARVCTNGSLSGSYAFASCSANAMTSCLFNGQTIANGQSVMAYLSSTASICAPQVRTCANGVLSGSAAYATCTIQTAASCLFNGQTIPSGSSVVAYRSLTTSSSGGACNSESRLCNNGVLAGSYTYASCSPFSAASCHFDGQTLAHGQSTNAYFLPIAENGVCSSETITCNNGSLSGNARYATCSNQSTQCILRLSGYDPVVLAQGTKFIAYKSSQVGAGEACISEVRECVNGSITGSYLHKTCIAGTPASCSFNGQTVEHGQSVKAYFSNQSVPAGKGLEYCSWQTRGCNNGRLSGTATYSSCEARPGTCSLEGHIVSNGGSITAFYTDSAGSCYSQKRDCKDGILSGSYPNTGCRN